MRIFYLPLLWNYICMIVKHKPDHNEVLVTLVQSSEPEQITSHVEINETTILYRMNCFQMVVEGIQSKTVVVS